SASLSKDDLVSLQQNIEANAQQATNKLGQLINSFTQIDTNGDGKISPSELQTFAQTNETSTTQGLSSSPNTNATSTNSSQSQETTTNSGSEANGTGATDSMATLLMQQMLHSYSTTGLATQQGDNPLLNGITA